MPGHLPHFWHASSADTLHLVGHSMGGLVILECLESVLRTPAVEPRDRPLPPGRIVLLASPVQGSRAAQRLARWPFGRRIMGLTAGEVLLEPRTRQWSGARDLGVIAGDRPLGSGHLLGPFDAPNDGTVLVEETRLAGAREHLQLRVSHSGMMLSARGGEADRSVLAGRAVRAMSGEQRAAAVYLDINLLVG